MAVAVVAVTAVVVAVVVDGKGLPRLLSFAVAALVYPSLCVYERVQVPVTLSGTFNPTFVAADIFRPRFMSRLGQSQPNVAIMFKNACVTVERNRFTCF